MNPRCNEEDLKQSAKTLARYHNAIFDYKSEGESRNPGILDLLIKMPQIFTSYADNSGSTDFDLYLLNNLLSLLDSIEQRVREINEEEYSNLLKLVIHGDFHPGNLKYKDNEVSGLFDFDWANLDFRSFDVGLAIMYYCTAWEGDQDGNLDLDQAASFLKTYQKTLKELSGLEPMKEPELDFLPHMISASNIFILNWTISDFYSKNADPSEYLMFLKHGIRGVNWFRNEENWYKLKEMIKKSG